MQYFIDSQDGSLHAAQNCNDKEPFFTVMSTAEFHECKEQLPYYKELLHCLGSIRYCKAEVLKTASSEHYVCLKKANSVYRNFPSVFI